ncbi:D-aminopeptidase [Saccharibacter sp. 17.LH.SD]|uniref:D-aminopeptidase n=1 Tax=Saccharibacter sp. 17.LH.SD TaxID=2689393 RepID=UPI00136FD28B|nr:D-aminopeptidase [Saccharibacter sp. 17.LH.SD]MXV45270.1 D-aminopeptidase [Saccharibacter sp. 17.LH.SD]
MSPSLSHRLDAAISSLAQTYPGPGGAVAVLHEGKVITRRCWGYASLERRLPFTPASLFRICSITKQFTCAVMLDRYPDPEKLIPYIKKRLPHLGDQSPTLYQLAHNQSGLRDYWAIAMLHGAAIEGTFNNGDARRIIAGTHSLQFTPGTSYSYVNQNFRLISDAMEEESGLSFAELLQHHVFQKANMQRACLVADTRAMPDGTTGYEGNAEEGFRPAPNNIYWTGDAGIGASLDDMIAWEQFIDTTRDTPHSLYNRLTVPVTFSDGTPSSYGFGLQRTTISGHAITAHSGALRGWRSCRLHCAEKRVSVVVFLNHMSPAQLAAWDVFNAFLGNKKATPSQPKPTSSSRLLGLWFEHSTGLSARIEADGNALRLRYLIVPERLNIHDIDQAENSAVTLRYKDGKIHMHRPSENRTSILTPYPTEKTDDVSSLVGRYACHDLEHSELEITLQGGLLYGGFSGLLGEGRMERLTEIGRDLWIFPCPRALDHTAPGDWTLAFKREGGHIRHVRVGCWLARNLIYERKTSFSS